MAYAITVMGNAPVVLSLVLVVAMLMEVRVIHAIGGTVGNRSGLGAETDVGSQKKLVSEFLMGRANNGTSWPWCKKAKIIACAPNY
ncbi:hypothetical protein [Magnetospirillum sp. 15-1]|uniref:hypothetical protein n=1 Tax=Magnetospirillum sp. 15-1 TaxID=1979370 RepID=UPI001F5B60FA|nr:hypothetical protein [Magnetospirillum sp. 15-1]